MMIRVCAAVVTVAQLVAAMVALARLLRNVPLGRRLINLTFPLSQLAVLVYLFAYVIVYELPLWVVGVLVVLGVLCNVGDRALFKALLNAESKELAAHRVALLEEQLVLQERHLAQLESDTAEAARIRAQLLAELDELDALLAREEGEQASEQVRHAVDLVSAGRRGFCSHRVVDALLTAKVDALERLGASVSCALDVPDDLPVPGVELCAVFSNLLDNAIHGCEEVLAAQGGAQPAVEVRAHVAGGYFLVEVANDCVTQPARRREAEVRGKGLAEHGWGLSILRMIAERRDGSLSTTRSGGRFVAKVALRLADEGERVEARAVAMG